MRRILFSGALVALLLTAAMAAVAHGQGSLTTNGARSDVMQPSQPSSDEPSPNPADPPKSPAPVNPGPGIGPGETRHPMNQPNNARDAWLATRRHGIGGGAGGGGITPPEFRPDSVNSLTINGNLWSNGSFNGSNGWSSEINGLGFITNRHADDFVAGSSGGTQTFPFKICLQPVVGVIRASILDSGSANQGEAGIWNSSSAGNGPANDALPTVLAFQTTATFSILGTAFGYPVKEYTWRVNPPVTLGSGRFWLSAASFNDGNSRGFWGTSSGGNNGLGTQLAFQRGFFGGTNWSSSPANSNLAFDLDGSCNLSIGGVIVGTAANSADGTDGAKSLQFSLVNNGAAQKDAAGPELQITVTSPNSSITSCSSSIGDCAVTGNTVSANYALSAGGEATIKVDVKLPSSGGAFKICTRQNGVTGCTNATIGRRSSPEDPS